MDSARSFSKKRSLALDQSRRLEFSRIKDMLLLGKIIMLFRELKQLTLRVVFYENATTIKIVFEINQ